MVATIDSSLSNSPSSYSISKIHPQNFHKLVYTTLSKIEKLETEQNLNFK